MSNPEFKKYKYHITYYDKAEDCICKGVNISANSVYEALDLFFERNPEGVFLSVMNVTEVYNEVKEN